jgi:peptide/nickel transport system permease protein
MDPLSWTGLLGPVLDPLLLAAIGVMVLGTLAQVGLGLVGLGANPDGTATRTAGDFAGLATRFATYLFVAVLLAYIVGGLVLREGAGIIGRMAWQFLPAWTGLVIVFALSITFKRRLGLYGKLFDSPIGMVGFGIVMFWAFTALFADAIITHDPLFQVSGLKNAVPGAPVPEGTAGFEYYLLGGDNLARDVFSRMVMGARRVLAIAPAATLFAFMVGITLGVPAGYFGGRLDTVLTFLANLVLAFPVILLFYLLVTPEIRVTGIPTILAAVLFIFPIVFLGILWNSRFHTQPMKRNIYIAITLVIGLWAYSGLAFNADPLGVWGMDPTCSTCSWRWCS